ncbi:hypothetical protein [Mesorhizobium sp.]|uniref:hypothetical protein n=1 Tax=Mesorhizobium sp. TaxID=1871066 RepID=UPI000FE95A27|nr:hypothetical protein [Mesorhizobium sp.]RWI35545.1 MAG: hypothetical protein EOR14_29010 [Mesorhizobium sp.]RWJ66448.1 MAG: hypothetical protein EOR34_28960 [Mesorhizobium sp.]
MTEFNLKVHFEPVNDQLAKAYVNDDYVGRVKIRGEKLLFRCSRNPYTNTVPGFQTYGAPMGDIIRDHWALQQLIPVVIRNYLRNTGFLYNQLCPSLTPEQIHEKLAA